MTGTRRLQAGSTLIEALIACAVVAVGALSIVAAQLALHRNAKLSQQRADALRVAQQALERLRTQPDAMLDTTADAAAGAGLTLERTVATVVAPGATQAAFKVQWQQRGEGAHALTLSGIVSTIDPALSGRLSLASPDAAAHPRGRALSIPAQAIDLGDGHSAWQAAGARWVFDNGSGMVVQICTAGGADAPVAAPPTQCVATRALVLQGHVGYSGAKPGAFGLQLSQTDARADCRLEMGDRDTSFVCMVTPPEGRARWSGRLDVVPQGWTLGHAAGTFRLCRYSADRDHDGRVRNAEHPLDYRDVDTPLMHQNFLLVPGDSECRGADAVEQAPQPEETRPSA